MYRVWGFRVEFYDVACEKRPGHSGLHPFDRSYSAEGTGCKQTRRIRGSSVVLMNPDYP